MTNKTRLLGLIESAATLIDCAWDLWIEDDELGMRDSVDAALEAALKAANEAKDKIEKLAESAD